MAKHSSSRSRQNRHVERALWIYGRHAVAALLKNDKRHIHRISATRNAIGWLLAEGVFPRKGWVPEPVTPEQIDALLPAGSVHQGVAVETNDLGIAPIDALCRVEDGDLRPVLVLDQLSDPHNILSLIHI